MTRSLERRSDAGRRPGNRGNRMILKRGHERQLVFSWGQSHGDKIQADGLELNLLSLRTQLSGARADESFVRLSIPIDTSGDEPAACELSRRRRSNSTAA